MDPRDINANELIQEIGIYSVEMKDRLRGADGNAPKGSALYGGIDQYEKSHANIIAQYAAKYLEVKGEKISVNDTKNPKFFREEFARFMAKIDSSDVGRYAGSAEERKNSPEKANLAMQTLFGMQGMELYKLALQEEANSKEFMNAAYQHSAVKFEGAEFEGGQRPIILVGGPSGSGKTTAAKAVVEKAMSFLKTKRLNADGQPNKDGNVIVSVDGGVGRELSQVMDLALQVAENKGYTGIKDIQSKSKVLDRVKEKIYNYTLKETKHGMVIPETFSYFFNKSDRSRKMLKEIVTMPGVKPIFARVQGRDYQGFKKVVAFMASGRAWQKNVGNKKKLTLRRPEKRKHESKAYTGGGFGFGVLGSILAESWFAKHAKQNISMVVSNELTMMKKVGESNPSQWVEADLTDKGAILVDRRIYSQWCNDPINATQDLDEYKEQNKAPTEIRNSSEMGMLICQKMISEKLSDANLKMYKGHRKSFSEGAHGLFRLGAIYQDVLPILENVERMRERREVVDWSDVSRQIKDCVGTAPVKTGLLAPRKDKVLTALLAHVKALSEEQVLNYQLDSKISSKALFELAGVVLGSGGEFTDPKYAQVVEFVALKFTKLLNMELAQVTGENKAGVTQANLDHIKAQAYSILKPYEKTSFCRDSTLASAIDGYKNKHEAISIESPSVRLR